jgi:2-keto-4-pentenoate hydratase/2-oxohepta-3-ene-1,7-dioic acid hydratase in catechol pathway
LGPYLLTSDEVDDPAEFELSLQVNGTVRQHGSCHDMLFPVDELISFWSRIGLSQGDIVASGTPEGVALHRKPDPSPYFLRPGDRVSAQIDRIGSLEVFIS